MSRSQFTITTFAQLIIGLAFLTTPLFSQEASPPVLVPCGEEPAPGRPILKQRSPAPDSSSPSISDQRPPEKKKGDSPDTSKNVTGEREVRFEGLDAFHAEEVLRLFREQRVWFRKDDLSTSEGIARALTVVKEYLEARGYLQASVDVLQDEQAKAIVLLVSEGPRFSVGEIRFEGNRILSSQELVVRMKEFLKRIEESNNGYDAEVFDYCLRQLTNLIRSRGYLQARLGESKKELTGSGLVVTVNVEEGALYRLGDIKIEGGEKFSQEQVRAMLSLQRGDIVNGEAIGKWLFEDLKELYGEMGYIQYMAEPEPQFRVVDQAANEGVVDFKVTIEEGRQFRIRSIKFDGTHVSEKELHNLLLIREGDVFNQQLFEKSVNQLNETEWFEIVDKDKDTDFRTDEEEALLDLTLRLKRKDPLKGVNTPTIHK